MRRAVGALAITLSFVVADAQSCCETPTPLTPSPDPTDHSIDPTDTELPNTPTPDMSSPFDTDTPAPTPTEDRFGDCPNGAPPVPPMDTLDFWRAGSGGWARIFTVDNVFCMPGPDEDPSAVVFQGIAVPDQVTPGDRVLMIAGDTGGQSKVSCDTGDVMPLVRAYWSTAGYWSGPLPGIPDGLAACGESCQGYGEFDGEIHVAHALEPDHGRMLVRVWTGESCVALYARWTRCYNEPWHRIGGELQGD